MIAGVFFGLMFGFGGIAALLGHLADIHGIEYVYKLCSYLPLFGVLAICRAKADCCSRCRGTKAAMRAEGPPFRGAAHPIAALVPRQTDVFARWH
jgi:hypothetical protein